MLRTDNTGRKEMIRRNALFKQFLFPGAFPLLVQFLFVYFFVPIECFRVTSEMHSSPELSVTARESPPR